ncbi:MAG TPA: phosphopentomutase, partial [Gemmatimonadaceae bacterium]|nr:phosphopentomutase [Gemmatimonadaceae bacterium]
MTRRVAVIVLDGVGIGAAPDAAEYGDVGSDTLGNIARRLGGLDLPELTAAGLGRIAPLEGVPAVAKPRGAWGAMRPRS